MTATTTDVAQIPPIARAEAFALAATENERMVDLLRSLRADDWSQPTDCTAWDVRALAGHVLGGMELNTSVREFVHQMRAGRQAAGGRPHVDGMTEVQVRERAGLDRDQLLARLSVAAPRAARARHRLPAPLRRVTMKVDVEGRREPWRLSYLFDVILTRDTWMHRVDIARAVGRDLALDAEHDGRLVADVVAEWARRHGRAFSLTLTGPAGGTFTSLVSGTEPGEQITLAAVEFCRVLSGRAPGAGLSHPGLLQQGVPF